MEAVMNIGGPHASHEEHELVGEKVHWQHQQQHAVGQRLHPGRTILKQCRALPFLAGRGDNINKVKRQCTSAVSKMLRLCHKTSALDGLQVLQ